MNVAMTETFLDDLTSLPLGVKRKGLALLATLRKAESKHLDKHILPGWRLHNLKSSPFASLSLDMNYRVLAKLKGKTIFLYRAIKHSLADSPRINKNDSLPISYSIAGDPLKPSDIYSILFETGYVNGQIEVFKDVKTEDDLLDKLGELDSDIAEYVLAVYETAGLVVPRTKITFFQSEDNHNTFTDKSQYDWDLYLHPSQNYIVELPVNSRMVINGSAGTGKTICAWYRFQYLAVNNQCSIGFVAPNTSTLTISKNKINQLLGDSTIDAYYLVPQSVDQLIQLAQAVDHIIIDEGQDFSPHWYKAFAVSLKKLPTGLTLFYDLNQLGNTNYKSGDNRRYENRVSRWMPSIESIPNIRLMQLFINYRNSKEISEFYTQILKSELPHPVLSEIPIFSGGEVLTFNVRDNYQLLATVESVLRKSLNEYKPNEIGIIILASKRRKAIVLEHFEKVGISLTDEIDSPDNILMATPHFLRGRERKTILVLNERQSMKLSQAIELYIAYSRAIERLIVIETSG